MSATRPDLAKKNCIVLLLLHDRKERILRPFLKLANHQIKTGIATMTLATTTKQVTSGQQGNTGAGRLRDGLFVYITRSEKRVQKPGARPAERAAMASWHSWASKLLAPDPEDTSGTSAIEVLYLSSV